MLPKLHNITEYLHINLKRYMIPIPPCQKIKKDF